MDFETLYYRYRDRSTSFEEVMEELSHLEYGAPNVREQDGLWALYYISPYLWKPTIREAMEHFLFDRIVSTAIQAIQETHDQNKELRKPEGDK